MTPLPYLVLPMLLRPGVYRPVLFLPRVGGMASLLWRSAS